MRIHVTYSLLVLLPTFVNAQASKGPQIKSLKGAEGTYLCVALSPDGKRVVTGARGGSITLWNAETRSELQTMAGHQGHVLAVAFAPKGDFFVSVGRDMTLRVWTLEGKEKLPSIPPAHWIAWLPGVFYFSGFHPNAPVCVAVSPDGTRIAVAGWDGAIHQYNAANGAMIGSKPADQGPIFSLAYSPDGKWLASGGRKGTVQVWETANELNHQSTLPGHGATVWAVAWSPDSATLAASADKSVKVWNVAEKKALTELAGHRAVIRSLIFADAGKKLISGSEDKTVRVWNLATRQAETLTGANAPVVGVVSTADGKTIYAVSDEAEQSARVYVLGKE